MLTDVLDGEVGAAGLLCRRAVYSNHLTGGFVLRRPPWCITLDAGWYDARADPPAEHSVSADLEAAEDDSPALRLEDVEVLEPPDTGDLETAGFLVVAGRGAGGRDGVERIAAAAGRMGAAFGVTRPVAMNAWAPADRQIGVSGARSAPAVCIVAGASGAPAFLWGVERAGFIAAVDTDERAAIAGEADAVVIDDGRRGHRGPRRHRRPGAPLIRRGVPPGTDAECAMGGATDGLWRQSAERMGAEGGARRAGGSRFTCRNG